MARRLLHRPLIIPEILRWADAHRERTGKWPTRDGGNIIEAKFESWHGVDQALRKGFRGLAGGSSLAHLLAETRGARNVQDLSPLTEEQILRWADLHHERTGTWPQKKSGTIPNSSRENWSAIDTALRVGVRGLPGGSSLARLLAHSRGVRNRKQLPPLRPEEILAWADAHLQRMARWPIATSGPIADAPGETWMGVNMALSKGQRGLPGGSSLALLLATERGVRNKLSLPSLSVPRILSWADAFFARTGKWPNL